MMMIIIHLKASIWSRIGRIYRVVFHIIINMRIPHLLRLQPNRCIPTFWQLLILQS